MFEDDPAPLFRKEFLIQKKIRRARVYVSGLGYYELRLNGHRVGDRAAVQRITLFASDVVPDLGKHRAGRVAPAVLGQPDGFADASHHRVRFTGHGAR